MPLGVGGWVVSVFCVGWRLAAGGEQCNVGGGTGRRGRGASEQAANLINDTAGTARTKCSSPAC